ncbi:MAG TPA: TonB-dependent receptor, partial [Polyangiaceae bacterium]|nr:TonB-dependent receptor [Polyangiaceae bacterium]
GVDVPLLYHAFFGPSVLHPGMIEDIELYAGAAPVNLGRFAGPIVAARTRPLSHQLRGEASIRLLDAGALVEAPFGGCVGPERPGCARGSAVVSGRYSYTGLVLSLLSDTTLRYWDLQSQVNYQLGPRDQLSLLAFGAYDLFKAENSGFDKVGGETRFFRGDLRWDHEFSDRTRARLAVTGGLDSTGDDANVVRDRSVRGRLEVDHTFSEQASMRAAMDVRFDDYALDANALESAYADFSALFPARTEVITGAYVTANLKPTKGFMIVPGLRTDVYRAQGFTRVAVDPRISAVIELNRTLSFEHSFGVAHQPPNFIPSVPGAQVADLRRGLQRALMASSGVRVKLGTALSLQANVFRTAYFNALDPIGGSRDFSVDRAALERRATLSAAGLEIKLSRPLTRRFGGFLAYTLSRSEQSSGALHTISGFDRPHVVQAALSYDFGAGIRAGVRGVYYSGIPARLLGQETPRFTSDRRGAPYFRLDARLEKRWRLGRSGYIGVTAEVLNATYTKEVLRLDCGGVCREDTAGPVILPSVGVEGGI